MALVITIRISEQKGGTGVEIEKGTVLLEKQIPAGDGMVRMSLVLDDKNELTDVEIVTEKIT